jgi:peptidoglycan/LPS O-acetylase OafA/YrhL
MTSAPRAYYLDRIRVVLTALVLFHHTAITYGASGGWYYRELPETLSLTGVLLLMFVSTNQSYFMGFFFLIAGYFTPGSYDRKPLGQFACDRLLRLGVPLLVFSLLLNPLTVTIVYAGGGYGPHGPPWPYFLHRLSQPWGVGPLWFAEALLLFTLGYVVWRRIRDRGRGAPSGAAFRDGWDVRPLPSTTAWLLSAIGVGIGAVVLRQIMPVGKDILGLQIGFFSSYVFLFALGTVAWHRDWFHRLSWRTARAWLIVSVLLSPALILTAVLTSHAGQAKPVFVTGFSLPALLYAFWEPFTAWGIIATYLVWFREHGNLPSAAWQFCSSRAYAVYIVHPPVLVAFSMLLRGWEGPALAKIAVCGTLACVGSLAVASLLVLIPGARRVL